MLPENVVRSEAPNGIDDDRAMLPSVGDGPVGSTHRCWSTTLTREPRKMTVAEAWRLLRRSLLSLRADGLRPTCATAWARVFSTQSRYVFVQPLKTPRVPVRLPVETNGLLVRQMTARDRSDVRVRWHEPSDVDRLALGLVATRSGHIVGAAWYTDSVTPAQPWYDVVEPYLIRPAWFDANLFVQAGEKGAAWAISKNAADVLASTGIGSTVAVVGSHNAPSILLLRLCGAKIVARMSVRRRFGHGTVVVEPVTEDRSAALGSRDAAGRGAGRSSRANGDLRDA